MNNDNRQFYKSLKNDCENQIVTRVDLNYHKYSGSVIDSRKLNLLQTEKNRE